MAAFPRKTLFCKLDCGVFAQDASLAAPSEGCLFPESKLTGGKELSFAYGGNRKQTDNMFEIKGK